MRQEANSLRAGRAKAMTSIQILEGVAGYFSLLYDPGTIPDAVWTWGIEQLYNQSMHWSPAHVYRYAFEMHIQLETKLRDATRLALTVPRTKRYPFGTFKQLLDALTRKIKVHNEKLVEVCEQAYAVMQVIAAETAESTEMLTYAKMCVEFNEFREYHKVLASAGNLLAIDWLNADLTTHPHIL